MSGDDGLNSSEKRKRRIAVIGISSLMLVAMVAAVAVGLKDIGKHHNSSSDHDGNNGAVTTSSKSVQSLCQTTDYRQTCVKTLSHTNSSDPKVLIKAGFEAAMKKIENALENSKTIKAAKDDPRTSGALEACKIVMEYAVIDLKRSVDQIGEFEFSKLDDYVENMRVWLSGALTFQESCIDAFENTTGNAGEEMKKLLNVSQQLTTNGLGMATQLSTLLKSFDISGLGEFGRLLSEKEGNSVIKTKHDEEDKFPHWIDMKQRRLLQTPGSEMKADALVAKDGSGQFKTIGEALKQVPVVDANKAVTGANKTFVIYIKEGIYDETIVVEPNMAHVMFVGDGPAKTKITGHKSFSDGFVVLKTATVAVMGSNFVAKDIGFENSAGAEKHQAVALLVQSDMSIFYNCHIDGYKDTLYAHSHRQFYRHCSISGTIDFILGNAIAVFQNCRLILRKPLETQSCTIAAHGRINEKEPTGFVLQNCTISADPAYYPLRHENKAYLGTPWKKFSRTIFMQSFLDDSIAAEGWKPWMGTFGEDTCFLSEYENRGPGAVESNRVKWHGIKKLNATEIQDFTPGKFYGDDKWILLSQIPYEPRMIVV
ncbi:putative pectinesterase/pectinesterase inhibitor 28 [Silene latifolia]|uniref:putative pectinesterase/pectinesterase inhibitor 28 n=1 Tax=Silene latifolia TaxID=37657 RepID=UPI003D77BE4D